MLGGGELLGFVGGCGLDGEFGWAGLPGTASGALGAWLLGIDGD